VEGEGVKEGDAAQGPNISTVGGHEAFERMETTHPLSRHGARRCEKERKRERQSGRPFFSVSREMRWQTVRCSCCS
jgi:hypothetical protein